MLENRKMMMRLFPELFSQHRVAPVAHYPDLLLDTLRAVAPAGVDEPDGGGADARHVQQRLLRARLPGAADGRGTGRGPGPVRARRLCVHAHHAGPAARGRDLPPRRRRLPRPAGLPRPTRTLGCAGLLDVYRSGNITLSNAIGTGVADDKSHLPVRAEDDRVLPRREADPEQRADLPVPRRRGPELRARPPGRAGGQGGARRRRLRHAGRPGSDEGRDRGLPQRAARPTPATTSPSPR